MDKITENIYNAALERIEELLPIVNDETSPSNRYAVELKIMSDIVLEFETAHFPVKNPSLADVIKMCLKEENLTQRAFAEKIGVSSSPASALNLSKRPSLVSSNGTSEILAPMPPSIAATPQKSQKWVSKYFCE